MKRTPFEPGFLGELRARKLLHNHRMFVDDDVVNRLAHVRVGNVLRSKGARTIPPIAKILTHARAVKKSLSGEATRADSLAKRSRRLLQSLNSVAAGVWFASINIADFRHQLERGKPSISDIEALIQAAEAEAARPSSGGRPPAPERSLVSTGKYVWRAAGQRVSFQWDRKTETLKRTPFICFLLDLFKVCKRQVPSDAALRGILRTALGRRSDKIA